MQIILFGGKIDRKFASDYNSFFILCCTYVCLFQLLHEKEFNPLAMQLVETFTNVLRNDGESVSRPVYVDEEDFDLTRAFADHLLYDKGR